MRLLQYIRDGAVRLGAEIGSGIVELSPAGRPSKTPMLDFIQGGPDAWNAAKRKLANSSPEISLKDVEQRLSPVTSPDKVICIGMNYKDHCEEQNAPVPVEPVIFNKFPSCIVGPNDDVLYPGQETDELDWEVELAVIIGKKGKHIKKSDALEHVFGYTVAHDVSARDWQIKRNGGQWFLGKTMDTFAPLGPVLVTTDDIPDPHVLGIRCRVNGVTKQDSSTSQLVHRVPELIEFLSRFVTLLPGDVILTGTPPGVGVFKKPPEFLKRGDVVECEIDEIGTIRNKIV